MDRVEGRYLKEDIVNKVISNVLVGIVMLLATSGIASANGGGDAVFPAGSALVEPPSQSAMELIREAKELAEETSSLRALALQDTSLGAFGSALQRYSQVHESLVRQLVLLEEAIEVADNGSLRIQAIRAYDRVEREAVDAKRFLAILEVR